jgi:Peptidase family M23
MLLNSAVVVAKSAVVVAVALLVATPAAAGEMEAPIITLSHVDWDAAAAALPDHSKQSPAVAFAGLNALTDKRFSGIGKSSVPVLLPFNLDAFRKDVSAGSPDVETSGKYFGDFRPTKFFLPGPAGYDATFVTSSAEAGIDTRFSRPIVVEITGAAFVYDLDGPNHQEVFDARGLDDLYPGIRRILREAHVRYAFKRFGVPYVVSIQCYDKPRSRHYLACKEADPIAVKFLRMLRIAGGTPSKLAAPHIDVSRPTDKSKSFTYYSPGYLIENTGWNRLPGRTDYHVYADIRFPIAHAPAYIKSQSFMPWGDCYKTGVVGHIGRKDAPYHCRRNGKPLVFNESAPVNFTYPWRDNFCELRDFLVGQCPGGHGHQGEDIRPANCLLKTPESDRCLPYQHNVAAVHDGMVRRTRGHLSLYIVVNTANQHVRYRYLHMNPKFMDADGMLNGRRVSAGEIIGKVGTWGDYSNGTSYHLHFNIQVFTNVGWVWVNPYMTLVAAYEHLIGARGTELYPGEPAPPVPDKEPAFEHPPMPPPPPAVVAATKPEAAPAHTQRTASTDPDPERAARAKSHESSAEHVRRHHRRHPRHIARHRSHHKSRRFARR